jgi:hypothetical protein
MVWVAECCSSRITGFCVYRGWHRTLIAADNMRSLLISALQFCLILMTDLHTCRQGPLLFMPFIARSANSSTGEFPLTVPFNNATRCMQNVTKSSSCKLTICLCKIWGFHGSDYKECRLLGYKTPVRTSQETHYLSATESSQLMLCKIWGSHGGEYEEWRLLGYYAEWLL